MISAKLLRPSIVPKPVVQSVPSRKNLIPNISIGAIALCSAVFTPALAADVHKIGEFPASGLVFKDSVEVVAFDDPEVSGVTLYLSDFKRSITDKISTLDFANEPSQASLTCAATGPISISDVNAIAGVQGKQVFSETRGRTLLFFGNKTLRIRRLLDEEKGALVYVSFSTRIGTAGDEGKVSTGRYRTSLCVVPLLQEAPKLTEES